MLIENHYTPGIWSVFFYYEYVCIMELSHARHSLAHILAQAVQRSLDPTVQLGTGPAVDNGFYYDMLFSEGVAFGEDNIKPLQKTME